MLAKITKDEFEKGIKMHQLEMYRLAFSIVRTDVDARNAVNNAIIRHLSTEEVWESLKNSNHG